MKRTLVLLALMLSVHSVAIAGSFSHPVETVDPSGFPVMWPGRDNTLPTGPFVTPEMILNKARTLWAIQPGVESMQQAGYLRRIDLDVAYNTTAGSVAVLGFQAPGQSPVDRQPVIIVVTRPDEFRYFTQVVGAVVETGTDGLPRLVQSTGGNFLVEMYSSASKAPGPFQPNFPDPVIWSSAYDLRRGDFPSAETLYFATGISPCHVEAVQGLMTDMGVAAAAAAIRQLRSADPGGAAWSAAIAAGVVAIDWVTHGPHCP